MMLMLLQFELPRLAEPNQNETKAKCETTYLWSGWVSSLDYEGKIKQ